MGDDEILEVLKTDLKISATVYEDYLRNLITRAKAEISREGITLSKSVDDGMLVESYAAFLYRSRKDDNPMPKHLRRALNNRLFSEKVGKSNG